jgi:predicted DCC family thiol-disulfide oxidoreductase YuxK
MTSAHPGRLTVLFDADCGFCQWSSETVARLDRAGVIRFLPLTKAAAEIPGAPQVGTLLRSMHAVTPAGEWVQGGEAWLRMMALVPVLRPLAAIGRMPLLRGLVDPGYAIVARNRHRLGRLVGRSSCRVDAHTETGGQS